MRHLGDITKISGYDAPIVDCIIGGSPCQDLSVAGKRAGLDGERSGLYIEQVRIVKEMRKRDELNGRSGVDVRPRYMVWENVPGAFSSNKGEDFRIVLEEIAKVCDKDAVIPMPDKGKWTNHGCILGDGWSVAWRVLDAQFWGVPQRRRRIALVADFGGQSAPEILFVRQSVSGHPDESKPKRKGTTSNAQGGIGADDSEGEIPYTLKIRSGCEGGGKGALIQKDKSATLSTLQDQTLFQPVYSVENHPNDSRVGINEDGKVQALTSRMGTGGGNVPLVMESNPSFYDVELEVAVRKYEVNKSLLQECLRDHKGSFTNKEIAEALGKPLTLVEHWFRRDNSFAIPDADIWLRLKELLGIETSEFDQSIMEFEFKSGNYDMRNRIHVGDTSPTLTCGSGNNLHLLPMVKQCYSKSKRAKSATDNETWVESDTANTLNAFDVGDVRTTEAVVYCLQGGGTTSQNSQGMGHTIDKGVGSQYVDEGKLIVEKGQSAVCYEQPKTRYIVRRLTPLECERLQGYPDGWTDIGEWVDSNGKTRQTSDAARYKALGNSIALPPWKWVLKRLCACYERDATMASLFDGIGGFPYLWEQLNGKGSCLWASEIEEFPMAVTKVRIGE
jgi:DNA (cytosine-5)-methyltransferase 1